MALLAVVGFAACGDATSPTDELSAARKRWGAWGPVSYDLVIERGTCECIPDAITKVIVAVRNGAVSRYRFDTHAPITETYLEYPAVPGLFDLIANAIAEGRVVQVKYEALTGAPVQITIDPQDIPVDGGYLLSVELRSPVPLL